MIFPGEPWIHGTEPVTKVQDIPLTVFYGNEIILFNPEN